MDIPRISLRPIFVIMAVFCFLLFLAGPIIIALVVLAYAPLKVSIWVALGALIFVAVLSYAMSSSFQWIELHDGFIRGKKLLTRTIVEQQIEDVVSIQPLNSHAMGHLENAFLDKLMKTSNRGYELRFTDGIKIGLVRGDMAGLDDFLVALANQLQARKH